MNGEGVPDGVKAVVGGEEKFMITTLLQMILNMFHNVEFIFININIIFINITLLQS